MHTRIVPTLAALCFTSSGLLAADYAPTLTIPVGSPTAAPIHEDEVQRVAIQPIFNGTLWDYTDGYGWYQIQGIAVTAATGGTWQYYDGYTTQPITAPSEGDAFVMYLSVWDASAALIFTPAPYSVADGTLSFRAWDASDAAPDQSIVAGFLSGGSSAYSTEERTLTIPVLGNVQPTISTTALTRTIRTGLSRNLGVSTLLSEAGASDSTPAGLGMVVTAVDTANATWTWADGLASGPVTVGLVLGPNAVITCAATAATPSSSTLSFVAHDGSDGLVSGDGPVNVSVVLAGWATAGHPGAPPLSILASAATLTVTIANSAPVVTLGTDNIPLVLVRGGPAKDINLTAVDDDGDTVLWSATSDYASGIGLPATLNGNPVTITCTPPALNTTALSGSITVDADDQFGGFVPTVIPVTIQDAPVIADTQGVPVAAPIAVSLAGGTAGPNTDLTITDFDSLGQSTFTWLDPVSSDPHLVATVTPTLGDASAATISLTSTHDISLSPTWPIISTVTLQAQDADGNLSAPVDLTVTITTPVNAAPAFDVLPPTLAVADQPYSGLIRATDPDGDRVSLSAVVEYYDNMDALVTNPPLGPCPVPGWTRNPDDDAAVRGRFDSHPMDRPGPQPRRHRPP